MSVTEPESRTIEQALFERMGVTVDDALATGTDALDEKVAQASRAGIDVEPRLSSLADLLVRLTEPQTLSALGTLIDRLPQLAQFASMLDAAPDLLATFGDVLDDFQKSAERDGIDVEKGLINGMHAALWFGNHLDKEDLSRIGEVLKSDILSPHALKTVGDIAKALATAQRQSCDSTTKSQVGLFGLIGLMRNPDIQRSVAFAAKLGECFGKGLQEQEST